MADSPSLVATYRLQLTPSFGLSAAAAVVPYLAALGISHVYTSSYLQSAAGSMHGYDTTDHAEVSEELGGEAALAEFHTALRAHGLGHVIDVVPNHMSVVDANANRRWWNVLRDGPASPDARFFDIDWTSPAPESAGPESAGPESAGPGSAARVLLPVLADDYAGEVAAGTITLVQPAGADGGEREIRYGPMRFPVTADTTIERLGDIHAVLEQQHYRLAHWRLGRDVINYRRFFDVTTLAGVRVEDPDVFAAVHARSLEWVRSGAVQGLRIDHPDGLRDPTAYLQQLRREAEDAWIVVEKILEPHEELPVAWPVDGTTGYDTMRRLTAVFVDPDGAPTLMAMSAGLDARPYAEQMAECKRLVVRELFGSEVTRLVSLATVSLATVSPAIMAPVTIAQSTVAQASVADRREVRRALEAMLVAMPVYRTYVVAGRPISAQDTDVLAATTSAARLLEPSIDTRLFDELGDQLRAGGEFAARFQQLSGPAMAKGLEDTLFYRYNVLTALNEVGSDPSMFGISVDTFHAETAAALQRHPLSMSATTTHDTKRSEDVRARIALLSEVADEWRPAVARWTTMNAAKWPAGATNPAMEHLLYQTLFGSPALNKERTNQFLLKAIREAKLTSSWLNPTDAERVLFEFADALADDGEFQADFRSFSARFDGAARIAALSQLTLKTLAAGVPDFYQGSELWTTSLVDPDNRTEVDYAERMRLLGGLDAEPGASSTADDGAIKMWLMRRLLQIRRTVPDAFSGYSFSGAAATYAPLTVSGARAGGTIALTRGSQVVVIVPIRPVALDRGGWADTAIDLPDGIWVDALGGPSLEGSIEAGARFKGETRIIDIRNAPASAIDSAIVLIEESSAMRTSP